MVTNNLIFRLLSRNINIWELIKTRDFKILSNWLILDYTDARVVECRKFAELIVYKYISHFFHKII